MVTDAEDTVCRCCATDRGTDTWGCPLHERSEAGYWEPWTPAMGQRVRVLTRPECYYCRGSKDEDGLVGIVEYVGDRNRRFPSEEREPGEAAHIYWVEFPDEIPSSGTHMSHFAAIELVPVED